MRGVACVACVAWRVWWGVRGVAWRAWRAWRGVRADLRLAILSEGLTTDTTSKLAVEDQVIVLQILILLLACLKTNLRQAVACHTTLAVSDRSPSAAANLGGGTGHTAEMAALACQRTNTRNSLATR